MHLLKSLSALATALVLGNCASIPSPRGIAVGPGNGIDKSVYLGCLYEEVDDWGWDTQTCDQQTRISFWRRGFFWGSAWDCYNACRDELAYAIDAGFPEKECSRTVGLAICEMGYNTRQ